MVQLCLTGHFIDKKSGSFLGFFTQREEWPVPKIDQCPENNKLVIESSN